MHFGNPERKYAINDEYYTTKESWLMIKDYLPRNKVIWECFYSPNSRSAEYLREITDCEVIYEDIDFCTEDRGEVLVSNMPFSLKQVVFLRLLVIDKPFIMICPTLTMQTKYFKNMFANKPELQVILPYKHLEYDKVVPDGEQYVSRCSFYSCFVCYKMNLPNGVNLV